MELVRVALVALPALLEDVVRTVIEADPGLRVVDETVAGPADVIVCTAPRRVAADVVGPLLGRDPPVRVVIIAADGRSAHVCTPSGELSAVALRRALRGPG